MLQLNDSDVYTPLDENPTQTMATKVNEGIHECFAKGNIDEKTRDYLLAPEDAGPGRF